MKITDIFLKIISLSLLTVSSVNAVTVTGTDTLDINNHEPWVDAHNQSTVNVLAGGDVAGLSLYDQAVAKISTGATVAWVYGYNQNIIDVMSGADVSYLYSYGRTSSSISAGSVVSWVYGYNQSTLDISGGDISWLKLYDNSVTTLTKAKDLSWLLVSDNSQVDIYGKEFSYSGGHLSGVWGDGTPFSFWAEYNSPAGVISTVLPVNITLHTVPLPAAVWLFASGAGLMFGFRKSA